MRARNFTLSPTAAPIPAFRAIVFAIILPLVLGACAVMFVSPYDEMTDRQISELVTQTETFLTRYATITDTTGKAIQRGKPYDSEAAKFYDEARGAAAAILLRSAQKNKNEREVEILTHLGTRYSQLEASHRLGPITMSSASALHRTLRALVQVQLTKKHIGTTTESTTPSNP